MRFNPMFANSARINEPTLLVHVFDWIFFHPIVANLPRDATKAVSFFKTLKFWIFSKKNWVFREKKLNLIETAKDSKLVLFNVY